MNLVDFYKDAFQNTPIGRSKNALFYLDRIRNGESKKIIELVRAELDKEKKVKIKLKLPAVTFAGTFTTRAKANLKKSSGLCILDFDKLKTYDLVLELKEKLTNDSFIYSTWISPSGDGLKGLIKIPCIESNDEYNNYYKHIVNHFEWVNKEYGQNTIDTSGQDISRLCFESYDPNIYINLDSELYVDFIRTELVEINNTLGVVTNVPLTDQDQIANRLMIWFKKSYNGTNRNSSFHKLALAFNDFGVEKYIAEKYILANQQKDFDSKEIIALINSAYKHTSNFGSKQFEDKSKLKTISNMILVGKTTDFIKSKFQEISIDNLEVEIKAQKSKIDLDKFWTYNEEGRIVISHHKFKFYLENKNFFKHFPIEKSKTFTFITKDGNFVDEVSEFQVKDFVLNELLNSDNLDPFDLVAGSTKSFTPQYLSMLETAKFNIEEDGADFAILYFKNCVIKVYKDKVEQLKYEDLKGFVWKKQVIERDFIDADHHESEFRTFLWLAASKNVSKYNSLKSVIGYLMHSYKTSANNKAIIFNDETISDNPNGGSGKSLFWNALSKMKKVASIDGKTHDFNKSFPYQTVPVDSQLLVFDDVKKNFNFESLFSLITEGITLEYKGQDAIKLPVTKSPKIIITTNYTIGGVGGSFDRRKFEVEMSSYFNSEYTPLDEFKHMLFDDWNTEEWARFDHFMINCQKYYLQNGLVPFDFTNLEHRKLINETATEFLEWMQDGNIQEDHRHIKSVCFDNFLEENKDFRSWLKSKRFTLWLQKYCTYYKKVYTEGNSNGQRWFQITTATAEEIQTEEIQAEETPQVIGNRLVKNEVEEANEWDSLQNKVL
jgi:hypothetical protein